LAASVLPSVRGPSGRLPVLQNSRMEVPESESDKAIFCRQVRARSGDLEQAMELVSARGLTSVTVGLLRQQLDSMVRVLFLIAQQDRHLRSRLISEAVLGKQWKLPTAKGRWNKVTDRDLVAAADRHDGWSARVYRFGCSFIHCAGSGHRSQVSRDIVD
jgi:hypothetical protein